MADSSIESFVVLSKSESPSFNPSDYMPPVFENLPQAMPEIKEYQLNSDFSCNEPETDDNKPPAINTDTHPKSISSSSSSNFQEVTPISMEMHSKMSTANDFDTNSNVSEKYNAYEEVLPERHSLPFLKELTSNFNSCLNKSSKSLPAQKASNTPAESLTNTCQTEKSSFSDMFDMKISSEHFEEDSASRTSKTTVDENNSTDPRLVASLEQELGQLREDNYQLVAVLQANNDAMRKNLKIAQELKDELKTSQKSYKFLKESTQQIITQLREENMALKKQLSAVAAQPEESSSKSSNLEKSIDYFKFDVNQEITIQDMSAKLIERDHEIAKLTEENILLKDQMNDIQLELSTIPSLKDQCKLLLTKYQIEETSNQNLRSEMKELKETIESLKAAKIDLEEKLEKGPPVIDIQSPKPEENNESKGRRKHSRHGLRKLEKRWKTALPVLNSGILFQGFRQYRTSSEVV